jgi:hypothetical protein
MGLGSSRAGISSSLLPIRCRALTSLPRRLPLAVWHSHLAHTSALRALTSLPRRLPRSSGRSYVASSSALRALTPHPVAGVSLLRLTPRSLIRCSCSHLAPSSGCYSLWALTACFLVRCARATCCASLSFSLARLSPCHPVAACSLCAVPAGSPSSLLVASSLLLTQRATLRAARRELGSHRRARSNTDIGDDDCDLLVTLAPLQPPESNRRCQPHARRRLSRE